MAKISIDKRDDFEKALKKFKLQCKKEGILKEFRKKQFYVQPSQKRRRKEKQKKS